MTWSVEFHPRTTRVYQPWYLSMSRWFRVFGSQEDVIQPEVLLAYCQSQRHERTAHFRGDEQGWFEVEFRGADLCSPLCLQRYLDDEEGIRAELNNWAAWLETREDHPCYLALMKHMIATRQLFTIEATSPSMEPACEELCQFLAQETDGVYQIDERGFFTADGSPLLPEDDDEELLSEA